MRFLLSNDDGIYAEGIYSLAKALMSIGDVYVVAPEREQSATGHAITIHSPLRCKKVQLHDLPVQAWWVNGTPADCIKLGVESLLGFRPDFILSGINRGENLGTDVIYSGTVSAAIEGALFGIPAMAFSYADPNERKYDKVAEVCRELLLQFMERSIPSERILNINIPKFIDPIEILGVKTTRLGVKKYNNTFEERKDPRGDSYFWLGGELVPEVSAESANLNTDIAAIKAHYISITPMHFDLTSYKDMESVENWDLTINKREK